MQHIRRLRIFISSPGDVRDERSVAVQLVERIRYDPFIGERADLQIVGWDRPTYPAPLLASEDPQTSVNWALPRPSDCDIVITILWSRMGTPLSDAKFSKQSGKPYRSGTEWELSDALENARSTGRPVVLLYHRTSAATVSLDDPDLEQKRKQYDQVRAFLNELKSSEDVDQIGGYTEFESVGAFRDRLEMDLRMVIARLCDQASGPFQDSLIDRGWHRDRPPFPGLRAFTPNDSFLFFGRDEESDGLVQLLSRSPFVAVVGPSGSGKSSLVGAGLIPRLAMGALPGSAQWLLPSVSAETGIWSGPRFTPAGIGQDLFRTLESALSASRESIAHQFDASLPGQVRIEETTQRAVDAFGKRGEILLFVDQFEELFTLVDKGLCEPFIRSLFQAVESGQARLVITLRADFFDVALQQEALARHLKNATFPLAKPGLGALYEMINRPAALAGLAFDPDLPEAILVDAGADPGALPLMAFALEELYRLRDGRRLTRKAYDELGGIIGAIGTRAERELAMLEESARTALPEVFRGLVEVDRIGRPIRGRALLDDLCKTEGHRQLVDSLVAARLLIAGTNGDGCPTIELAHEALLVGWRRLADWLESAHSDMVLLRRLRLSAEEWQQSQRDPLLQWPHERLAPVYEMLERVKPSLADFERAFVRPEADRLLEELSETRTPHRRRAAIGERLAAIGDPRPGVAVRGDGLPDIAWCPVYTQGGRLNERPSLYIAKYPITGAQFEAFRLASFLGDAGCGRGGLDLPAIWANRPAAANWHEAVEFCGWCNWVIGRLTKHATGFLPDLVPPNWEIRLPTQEEWELAATAGWTVSYPWGKEWDDNLANGSSSELSRTVAVGMYPAGAASTGAMDMSGNVWEWCWSPPQIDKAAKRRCNTRRCSWLETVARRVVCDGTFAMQGHDLHPHARRRGRR